jgi:hypothetical protein
MLVMTPGWLAVCDIYGSYDVFAAWLSILAMLDL